MNEGFGKTILVDSSHRQLEFLKYAFHTYNSTECLSFEKASKALEIIQKQSKVDLIVIDWLGMDLDVFDFLKQARKNAASVNSKIIITGPGNTRAHIRESLLSTGADYYMIKPYTTDTLFQCIEALTPVYHLPVTTVWDAGILRGMKKLGFEQADVSFWYLSSCLQQWLTCEGKPQLKSVYMRVGEQFHVSDKAVESGVLRAIRAIAAKQKLIKIPTCKEWLSETAQSIWFEYNKKNRSE